MKVFIESLEAKLLGLEGLGETTHENDEYVVVELDTLIDLGAETLRDCNKRSFLQPIESFRAITSIVKGDGNSFLTEGVEIDLDDMEVSKFFHSFCINIELAEDESFEWPDDIFASWW